MWPNAVKTFNRPSVYKKFVWVTSGFIGMLIKNICKNMKILKKNKNMIRGIHYFSTELKLMSSQGAALSYELFIITLPAWVMARRTRMVG